MRSFEKQGIKIHTKTKLLKINKKSDHAEVEFEVNSTKQKQNYDIVIMAVGIVGNTENIGLENTKVKIDKTHVITDDFCQTAETGIYAIGDLTAAPWLAHKASHEGILCAEHIAGNKVKPIKNGNIPGCTYSHPQIASIGLTEAKARELGLQIKVGKFPFSANGKAIALGEEDGLIKTIFDQKTGELVGAHMIGAEVTELIACFALGKTLEATEEEFMHTIFAHPTLSEMIHESVLNAFDRAIHI